MFQSVITLLTDLPVAVHLLIAAIVIIGLVAVLRKLSRWFDGRK